MNKYFTLLNLFFAICIMSCGSDKSGSKTDPTNDLVPTTLIETTIEIFKNDSTIDSLYGGYGYKLMVDGVAYVHQPNIPAVAGNKGFASEEDALKTAGLMTAKIKNRIMPPSISVHELDSMGVRY